ncbi:MAG TPA: DUF309 domain-containing protein [Candidatus Nitrosocosmicus sp.]|nr:DUF309 domain-containing protein [Candidatus Nitrosocosmicus sp.]
MTSNSRSHKYRYLVYLSNKTNYIGKDHKILLQEIRSSLQNSSKYDIRDLRISSYFIELDVASDELVSSKGQNWNYLLPISKFGYFLKIEQISDYEDNIRIEFSISTAIFLFNMERFWKSHEVLEQVWKESTGLTKSILNGIILVDAAFVHLQKGESEIYFSILHRSIDKFVNAPDFFYGINLEDFVKQIRVILSTKKETYFKIKVN